VTHAASAVVETIFSLMKAAIATKNMRNALPMMTVALVSLWAGPIARGENSANTIQEKLAETKTSSAICNRSDLGLARTVSAQPDRER
jgi:hypothetical protein